MFSRSKCKEVKEEAQRLLNERFGDRFRVVLKNGRFRGGSFIVKLEFAELSPDGLAETIEAQDFMVCAGRVGFEPDDLGKEFQNRGVTYRIIGFKYRARRYPVLCEGVQTRKRICFTVDTVLRCIGRQPRPSGSAHARG